jgi:hypothetical protein
VNIKYRNGLFYCTYGTYINGVLVKRRHWGKVAGDFGRHYRTYFGYNMHRLKMWFVHRWWDFQHRNDPDWGEGGG